MEAHDHLTLDDLVFHSDVVDPVSRAIRAEKERIAAKFDPMVEEIKGYEIDTANITTLSDAADLILVVRAYYGRASAVLGEILMERRLAQVRRDVSKSTAEQKIADLIRNDPEVRSMTPQSAQQARAQNKARTEVQLASGCQELYLVVSGYYEMIDALAENLKDAKKDLDIYTRTMRDARYVGENAIPVGPTAQHMPL